MNTHRFVWRLSHDEVNQYLAPGLGAAYGVNVQPRLLKEGLPDGDCRALVVDLDSTAPSRPALHPLHLPVPQGLRDVHLFLRQWIYASEVKCRGDAGGRRIKSSLTDAEERE